MKPLLGWLSWNSLRTRIALVLVGLTLSLGIVALFQASVDLSRILEEQLRSRGIAIARDLAARTAAPSQTNDVFAMYQVVNDGLLNNRDVRYVFFVEPSGRIPVHTFEDGVPPDLAEANSWNRSEAQSMRLLRTTEGPVLDIAAPVLNGQGGVVRVGMSLAGLRGQVATYIGRLSLLVALAVASAVGLSIMVSGLLTRPLSRIVQAVRKVGGGELTTKVPAGAKGEFGDLAKAFNTMTEDLVRSRESLVLRNAELEVLNAMADTLSRQLVPGQVLEAPLDRLLELTGLAAAWVCTPGPGGRVHLAAARGVGPTGGGNADGYPVDKCPCHGAFAAHRGRVFAPLEGCPVIAPGNRAERGFSAMGVVPLWARDSIVGVLGVAAKEQGDLDEARLQLLSSIGRQMGVALENARLYEALEQKERVSMELLDKLIGAQEEERKRIAREIHDEPTQELTGVLLGLEMAARRLVQQPGAGREEVEEARQRVRGAVDSLHRIITELRPQALDDLGYMPAIRWYAEQRLVERGVEVDFGVVGQPVRLPPAVEVAAFRITQEAINNVAKHAQASHVRIQLRFGDSAIGGEVSDDGGGFDPGMVNTHPTQGAGLGLMGMRERAVLLGGTFQVSSTPFKGTMVRFTIPLPHRS